MRIGELIGLSREIRGWSQAELAKNAGLDKSTVCRLEQDATSRPDFWKVVCIAKTLNVKLDRFAACDEPDQYKEVADAE